MQRTPNQTFRISHLVKPNGGSLLKTINLHLKFCTGRPEEELIRILPEAEIQKAIRRTGREKDPRKQIKETAAATHP